MNGTLRALRRRASVIVSLALLLIITVTFLTGFIAAALDLNRFVWHKYAAYGAIALASLHVILHARSLLGQVRTWLLPGSKRRAGLVVRDGQTMPHYTPPETGTRPRRARDLPLGRRAAFGAALGLTAGIGIGRWWAGREPAPLFAEGDDLGQIYHRWSNPSYGGLLAKSLRLGAQPSPYKEYPGAPAIPLPPPPTTLTATEATLNQRRSIREYADRAVTLDELGRLLHGATGITDRRDPSWQFRTVPSSGALYPLEIYPLIFNVAGTDPGVYHYDVRQRRLNLVRAGDFRQAVFEAAVSQEMIRGAAFVLVVAGVFGRVQHKYVDRAYRYLLLEAGHLGQNVYLTATALGLGPCGIGAYFDDQINAIVGLDGHDEATVYLLAIGAARQ
jgi:SagB-type dehydrogenase family enzyme